MLGLIDCAVKTYRYTGVRGFTRGLDANIVRNAIMNGSELAAYDYFKRVLASKYGMHKDSFVTHLACGTLAGLIGAVATSPPEVIKNR